MKTNIQPYLFFNGRCDEALEFYRTHLGAEVQELMRFKESPDPLPTEMHYPGYEEKVMHAAIRIGESSIMMSDGCRVDETNFAGFSLSLNLADQVEAKRTFDTLAKDGEVTMPLDKTFWSPCFGMVTDRFGLCWMINMPPADES